MLATLPSEVDGRGAGFSRQSLVIQKGDRHFGSFRLRTTRVR